MTVVVAARFESFPTADSAAHALFAEGFREDAVNIFYVNADGVRTKRVISDDDAAENPNGFSARYGPQASVAGLGMMGAMLGAGVVLTFEGGGLLMLACAAVGAFLGSWVGILGFARNHAASTAAARRAHGVLLTAQVDPDEEDMVAGLLRDAGGLDVERARGRWRHGRWTENDNAPRKTSSTASTHFAAH